MARNIVDLAEYRRNDELNLDDFQDSAFEEALVEAFVAERPRVKVEMDFVDKDHGGWVALDDQPNPIVQKDVDAVWLAPDTDDTMLRWTN